jgi:hypothetical protein
MDPGTEIRIDLILDEATQQERLWEQARGRPWRPTYEDLSFLLAEVWFVVWFFWLGNIDTPMGLVPFVLAIAGAMQWRQRRLESRVDGLLKLLEQTQAKHA